MTRGAGVVFAFRHAGKPADPAELAQGMKLVVPTGKNFMCVCLVSDVPNDFILGHIIYIMKRDGQFDRAEARREVPAGFTHHVDHEFADFLRKVGQCIDRQLAKVRGGVNGIEEFHE